MFDTVFGAEMPLAVRFFLAFLVVLGLIGATAWAVRRFGTGRLGANTRGRQPRLAVIDYASVDGRRRLLLVRRDNVEHLLMVGGPTDVVVESNIVRAVAAPREVPGARPTAGIEALPRAIPLPENGGSWPLQPEPTGGPRPAPRLEPLAEELPPPPRNHQPHAEPPSRPARDTLAALADELSTRAASAARGHPAPLPASEPEQTEAAAAEPVAEARGEQRTEPRLESRPESRLAPRKPIMPPAAPIPPAAPPAAAPAPAADVESEQALAEMAQRLEAALRKPSAESRSAAAPRAEPAAAAEVTPRAARPGEPKPPRPETKSRESKTLYDNLEQEMASLLGRQTKT